MADAAEAEAGVVSNTTAESPPPSSNKQTDWHNTLYDCFAVTLSLADIATDLVVAYTFYRRGRMIFFWLSCTIFMVAQLAYSFAFVVNYGHDHSVISMAQFSGLLLISPFQSLLFFLVKKSKTVRDICSRLGFQDLDNDLFESRDANTPMSTAEYFQSKTMAHLGFILESLFEAFPQSILQLVAIVTLEENNNDSSAGSGSSVWLSACSILLSMISVCSKTLLFSRSNDTSTFIFYWLCFVTDGFGIFATVAWVFDNGLKLGTGGGSALAWLWLAQIAFGALPSGLFFVSILLLEMPIQDLFETPLECLFNDVRNNCGGWLAVVVVFPCWLALGLVLMSGMTVFVSLLFLAFVLVIQLTNLAMCPMLLWSENMSHEDKRFYDFIYRFCMEEEMNSGGEATGGDDSLINEAMMARRIAEWSRLMNQRSKRKVIQELREASSSTRAAASAAEDTDEKKDDGNVVRIRNTGDHQVLARYNEQPQTGLPIRLVVYFLSYLFLSFFLVCIFDSWLENYLCRHVWKLPLDVAYRIAICNTVVLDMTLESYQHVPRDMHLRDLLERELFQSHNLWDRSQADLVVRLKYLDGSNVGHQQLDLSRLRDVGLTMRDLRDNLLYWLYFQFFTLFKAETYYEFQTREYGGAKEYLCDCLLHGSVLMHRLVFNLFLPLKFVTAVIGIALPIAFLLNMAVAQQSDYVVWNPKRAPQSTLSWIYLVLLGCTLYFGFRASKFIYVTSHLYSLNWGYPMAEPGGGIMETAEMARRCTILYGKDCAVAARDLIIHEFFDPLDDIMFALLDDTLDYSSGRVNIGQCQKLLSQPKAIDVNIHSFSAS